MQYLAGVVTLELEEARCNGCRRCVEVCPHGVFSMVGRKARIGDRDACMECGGCALNCTEGAIIVRAGVGCAYAVLTSSVASRQEVCCGPATDGGTCC